MKSTLISLMAALAGLFLDGNTFDRIKAVVDRWDDKVDPDGIPYNGDEKRDGVKEELELIGIKLAQWLANLLIELAVATLRIEQGKLEK